MLRIEELSNERLASQIDRNTEMSASIVGNDERWVQYVQETLKLKSDQYKQVRSYGILTIAILVFVHVLL